MEIDLAEEWLKQLSSNVTPERATEINWLSYSLIFRAVAQNKVSRLEPDHFRIITDSSVLGLSQVVWGGTKVRPLKDRVIEITETVRREIGASNISFDWYTVGSDPEGKELENALLETGWRVLLEVPGMTCSVEKTNGSFQCEDGFSIERVRTENDVSEWLPPFMEGFSFDSGCRDYLLEAFTRIAGIPDYPFWHFALKYRGAVITTGSIQFRYGTAVIYNICTLKKNRRLGGATTIVSFLKHVAAQEGYSTVSLFAMEAGQGVYEKLGFTANSAVTRMYRFSS